MTIDEASERSRQLNAQLLLKRQEEIVQKIRIKEVEFQLRNKSVLPEIFVAEFEQRFIHSKLTIPENKRKSRTTQRFTAWRAAQRIIVEIGLEPTSWFYHQDKFYELFFQKKFSVGYVTKNQKDYTTESWCDKCEFKFTAHDTFGAQFFRDQKFLLQTSKVVENGVLILIEEHKPESYSDATRFVASIFTRHYLDLKNRGLKNCTDGSHPVCRGHLYLKKLIKLRDIQLKFMKAFLIF